MLAGLSLSRSISELPFNVLADRYERRSTVVTTTWRSASG